MDVYDAAERYRKEEASVIILAGKDYGSGSSRDWAAKGPWIMVSYNLVIIKKDAHVCHITEYTF